MILTLLKQEFTIILSNRRYLLSLGLQLLLLFAIIPVFGTFFSTGAVSITTPALNEFVPLGVVDQSPHSAFLRASLSQNKKIDLMVLEGLDYEALDQGRVAGILLIPPSYDETSGRVLDVRLITNPSNLKEGAVFDAIYLSIQETSEMLGRRRRDVIGISLDETLKVERHLLRPLVVEEGGSRFSSFFLSYLIPLMLFFPIFTVGSIVLDSVVGERERKTVEAVLVAPLSRGDIVLSKFLSAASLVFFQTLLWLGVFRAYGVPVQNVPVVIIMILVVDSAVISTAILLTYYSDTVKEANIMLMLLYTTVFIALILSLSVEYFGQTIISNPFSIVSALVAGGSARSFWWSIFLIGYTGLAIRTNIGLIERDDINFGPRPSLERLLSDLALWLYSSGKEGYLYLTLLFAPIAFILLTAMEVAAGVIFIFTIGFSSLLLPVFALIEEALKPLGPYLLANKQKLTPREGVFLGVLAGLAFFILESVMIAFFTNIVFPIRLLVVLKLRLSTTMLLHATTSGVMGYGIARGRHLPIYLLAATILHTLFNLIVPGGSL